MTPGTKVYCTHNNKVGILLSKIDIPGFTPDSAWKIQFKHAVNLEYTDHLIVFETLSALEKVLYDIDDY